MKLKSNDFSKKKRVFIINQNETPNWKTLYFIVFIFNSDQVAKLL